MKITFNPKRINVLETLAFRLKETQADLSKSEQELAELKDKRETTQFYNPEEDRKLGLLGREVTLLKGAEAKLQDLIGQIESDESETVTAETEI